ncbi:LysR family transcriptional regulator, partial [Pseudomonas aeruginosa]
EGEPSDVLARFIERVQAIEVPDTPRSAMGHRPNPPEEAVP